MGRLIDADKLLEETRIDRDYARKNGFLDMYYERQVLIDRIEAQPTAYDPDKVVEQLESELRLADKEKLRCARENPLQFDSAKGYSNGVANSIEIVKQEAEQYNNGWIPCSGCADCEHKECMMDMDLYQNALYAVKCHIVQNNVTGAVKGLYRTRK